MDDTRRTLVCLIEGEFSPFIVKPTADMIMIKLKNLVKEEGMNATKHIPAKDIILWKVRIMVSDTTLVVLTLIQVDLAFPPIDEWRHLTGKKVPNSVRLEGVDSISVHWPTTALPNPQHLQIIVELPCGKRCVR